MQANHSSATISIELCRHTLLIVLQYKALSFQCVHDICTICTYGLHNLYKRLCTPLALTASCKEKNLMGLPLLHTITAWTAYNCIVTSTKKPSNQCRNKRLRKDWRNVESLHIQFLHTKEKFLLIIFCF